MTDCQDAAEQQALLGRLRAAICEEMGEEHAVRRRLLAIMAGDD